MHFSRRSFLKSTSSSLVLAAVPTTMIGVRPARAVEPVTVVLIIIAIVSAVASMFARPNGNRQILAALNAKLDAVIRAQEATLESIQLLSKQVDSLAEAIPEFLVQEDLRNVYTKSSSILNRLDSSLKTIESGGATDEHEKILDDLVHESWIVTGEFYEDLRTTNAGHNEDLGLIHYCTRILHVQRDLLTAFKAADRGLGREAARGLAHQQKYRDIADAIVASISLFRTRHLVQSKSFHDAEIDRLSKVIEGNSHTKQWHQILQQNTEQTHSKSKLDFSFDHHFATIQSFGWCPGGHNSDDIKWAEQAASMRKEYWKAYFMYAPVSVSGTGTFYQNSFVGYSSLSMPPGAANRELRKTGTVDELPRSAKARHYFSMKMPTKEFNCPGLANNDADHWSLVYTRQARDWVEVTVPKFVLNATTRTMHQWASIAAALINDELEDVLADSETSKSVIHGA